MRPRALVLPFALAFLAPLLAACGGGAGDPPVLYVTTLADAGPGSLRQVVLEAPPGARVLFDPAIAGGVVTLLSPIGIGKPLWIDGGPPGSETTLDGDAATRHFDVENAGEVRFESLILRSGGSDGDGGSLLVHSSTVSFHRVAIVDGFAIGVGGGICAFDSDLSMTECNVQGCIGSLGGGLYLVGGSSRILHSSIVWNAAIDGVGGGMLLAGGDRVVRSCTIHANVAHGFGAGPFHGGGIAAGGAPIPGPIQLGIYGCTITANDADTEGGGVSFWAENVVNRLEVRQTLLADNTSPASPDLLVGWIGTAPTIESAWNVVGILAGGPIWHGIDGNLVGDPFTPVDPLLGPVVGVGMETRSRSPLAGSPALDAVPHAASVDEDGDPLLLDQHFAPRTADVAADVGAIEAP